MPVVILVDPHNGESVVVAGNAVVDAAKGSGEERVMGIQLSVEEGKEWTLATAGVLAIRGTIDDETAEGELAPLTKTIRKHWDGGADVPWTEMLAF